MSESPAKVGMQDGLAFERQLNDLQTKIEELRKLNTGSHLELTGEIELLETRLRRRPPRSTRSCRRGSASTWRATPSGR